MKGTRITVPTGKIYTYKNMHGHDIEFLTVGDYGKERNVKADFLGLTKTIEGVADGGVMPLSKKWVTTISTQAGCSMGCKFCDVPLVGSGRNIPYYDLAEQVRYAIANDDCKHTERFNLHFARMGEPTWNNDVLWFASCDLRSLVRRFISADTIHPVVSTMMPRHNKQLLPFLKRWVEIKNKEYKGEAGLQISINTTDDRKRDYLFGNNSHSLADISAICGELEMPVGRKYALNIALVDDSVVCAKTMRKLFSPDKFMVKITPIHVTKTSTKNDIKTDGGYAGYAPYDRAENELKAEGFDVLVFVPSLEEDKGMITCGNAVLSKRMPEVTHTVTIGEFDSDGRFKEGNRDAD